MEVKLLQWEQNREANNSVLGWAKIVINDKLHIWMTVIKGSKGTFVKLPSIKMNGQFISAVEWPDSNIEQKIREAIMPEINKKLGPPQPSNAPTDWF